jgi:ketosteroid isomerase-like protein
MAENSEQEINQLEDQRYQAIVNGDFEKLDALLADEFFYNRAGGDSLNKSEYLTLLKSGESKVKKVTREGSKVRFYGDIAVVTAMVHIDLTTKGEDRVVHLRYLHMWDKGDKGWKLVARQATYLPAPK